jgi:hypothetical protein
MLLSVAEGFTEITESNKCRLCLVMYGLAPLFTLTIIFNIIHENSGNFK